MRHLFLFALLFVSAAATAENIALSTPSTTMVVAAERGAEPTFVYYGQHLSATDLAALPAPTTANWSHLELYPAYGATHTMSEVALAVTHSDGNMSTALLCTDYTVEEITDSAPNGATRTGTLLTLTLADPLYPFTVHLYYFAYADVDMIECWTDITHDESSAVTLTQFFSSCLPIRRGNVYLSHQHGSWAAEAQLVEEPLRNGLLTIKNKDGLRNATTDRNEVLFSLDGAPQENTGEVIGAALLYAGNYAVKIDTDDTEYHYYFTGINPDNSAYHLAPSETFTTPRVAYAFSTTGIGGVSRTFHDWARRYHLRHGDTERLILLNSWEGVYFDITQEGMAQMMADIAALGGELFVMDDGWFGDKYPRLSDNSSLGDWVVDSRKLPEGIEGLLRAAKKNGIKFGIWLEPEMANTTSELYEAHPDWIIQAPGREPVLGRGGTQVVLDLSNPAVQDYVFDIFDNLLSSFPEIAYIKWDANAPVMNHGSNYLDMSHQSHLYIDYHTGLLAVCQRLRDKYPAVTIQDCASGGGRANYGLLPYFDEFWVSDNTDALQRIYMQWGTSYFFPAIAMAQHISAVPNHTVFRTTSLKYRCDVAMSGRLGMEMQPQQMTAEERAFCKQVIADYKTVRTTIQLGDLYRLTSPYSGLRNLAALMYVSKDKDDAVFFWYKLTTMQDEHLPRVLMQGLDANKRYVVHEVNRIDNTPLPCEGQTYSGAYLMANGLEMPYRHDVDYALLNDYSSRVLHLTAVDD